MPFIFFLLFLCKQKRHKKKPLCSHFLFEYFFFHINLFQQNGVFLLSAQFLLKTIAVDTNFPSPVFFSSYVCVMSSFNIVEVVGLEIQNFRNLQNFQYFRRVSSSKFAYMCDCFHLYHLVQLRMYFL